MRSKGFPTVIPPPVGPEGDDRMDLADIGIIYNDPSRGAANSAAFSAYMTERSGKAVSLRASGPQSTDPQRNSKREPGIAYFDSSIVVTIGGTGNPSSFALYSEGGTIQNNVITGNTPIMSITRQAGTTPLIVVGGEGLKFISTGAGLEFITPGSTTFCTNCTVEYSGTGVFNFDDWSDLLTATYGMRVKDADGLFVDGFFCGVGSGHGVLVDRWNAGGFQGNVREAAGSGFKAQNVASITMDGRFESNKGFGLHLRDSGINKYEGGTTTAQDGSPYAWQVWCENNNGRDSTHAATSGGYQYTQAKVENCASGIIAGHTGWGSNMWRIDEGSRNNMKLVEALRIEQSKTPNFQLVTNNTVDTNITLPAAGLGNAAITNWDAVWTNALFRPDAVKIGTAGTDERIRVTWPAGSFDNTASPTTGYWRPWGATPLTSPGTFIWEVEYSDVTGAGPQWCEARETATQRQSPRLGAFHIAPGFWGWAYSPIWNNERRKLQGKIFIGDARSDISPAFDAWFPGMELLNGGANQPSDIVYDIWQWKMWKIA